MDRNWVRPRWSQVSRAIANTMAQAHGGHCQGRVGVPPGIITRLTRARQVKPSPTVRTASQVHVLWPSPVLLHTA